MPTLAIHFPAGRYHATPWCRHVNEGAVEWPPSPWRLLRSLLAAGFAKCHWPGSPEEIPPTARSLIEKLASVRPIFLLPEGGVAHSRHWMPTDAWEVQNNKPTRNLQKAKVLDTFLRFATPGCPLLVRWEVDLGPDELATLVELASGLSYLGRAESWADASLVEDLPMNNGDWSRPHCGGEPVPRGWEQTPLLAPVAVHVYAEWRQKELEMATAATPQLTKKNQIHLEAAYPRDLIDCLCTDTAALQKAGWNQPPGSERALYLRRADALEPAVARPRTARRRDKPAVEAALLTLASDTTHGQLCPQMIRAFPHMLRLHATAVRRMDGHHPVLSGCDAERVPLQGHQHAHWLPLDLDGDGRLEHVLVVAPMGLNEAAQNALSRISRTYGKHLPALVVSLAGFDSLASIRRQLRDERGAAVPELGTSTMWTSHTPFLAPRHLKPRGRNDLSGQVRAECESRGLPTPLLVEQWPMARVVKARFLEYVRSRDDKPPPQTRPFGLRLVFPEPVAGPICLGYGSHFGLGLFAAETPE